MLHMRRPQGRWAAWGGLQLAACSGVRPGYCMGSASKGAAGAGMRGGDCSVPLACLWEECVQEQCGIVPVQHPRLVRQVQLLAWRDRTHRPQHHCTACGVAFDLCIWRLAMVEHVDDRHQAARAQKAGKAAGAQLQGGRPGCEERRCQAGSAADHSSPVLGAASGRGCFEHHSTAEGAQAPGEPSPAPSCGAAAPESARAACWPC